MDDIESQLLSEDYGKDLASVNNLLKKHEMLEADEAYHSDVCDQIKDTDLGFFKTNHFLKEEIHERAMNSVKRYYSLHEPTTIQRDNLEDSQLLHQFLRRDAEDVLDWLKEREHIASSSDLGNSLTAVQSLQKKHHALESEILSQEPSISSLLQRGSQMLKNNHFATDKIESRINEIQQRLAQLQKLASIRRLRLLDAVESQMFYAEANEAESWMKEKYPILASQDYGKDEDSVQSGQKKLEALQREIWLFSQNLLDRGHFDHININQKNETIQKRFQELKDLAKLRDAKLLESRKLYDFIRNVEEVQEWIADQTTIAGLEEYGSDVEHVEQLITTFDSFISNLGANESRIIACVAKGEQLLIEKNPYRSLIKQKTEETKQLWEELKDLIKTRQDALAGAKQVHVYDRTADETITWINEKETALLSEDYGQDLEAIQALVRKHEIFETELAAVCEQVTSVLDEAKKLGEVYSDAKDHIEVKREDMIEAWSSLLDKTHQRKEKLKQAEQLQAYFDEYRELMSWINEMLAKITAAELAKDVLGAELLLARTKEHQTEIDARKDVFDKFYKAGTKLVFEKHVFANEIHEKITVLEQRQKLLELTLQRRKEIYELNLDTQVFVRDAEILMSWITSREPHLKDSKQALNRMTKLENAFRKQKADEIAAKSEKERIDRERLEAIKQKEVRRITYERWRYEANQKQNVTNGITHEKPPIFSSPQIKSSQMYQSPMSQKSNEGPPISAIQKSNSFVTLFGDKLRRGSEGNIKRAESMKIGPGKQAKRTPSFTTRHRGSSFRKNQADDSDFAAIEIQGMLERKHELQSGGKKSPVRSWKPYHTVLCGQLLCFFKDEEDFIQKKAVTAPVNILNAQCEKSDNYTKRKNVFRIRLPDGSEFLFLANSGDDMDDWIKKLSFHASLPPNLQLLSYDESKKQSNSTPDIKAKGHPEQFDGSSVSSRASSPDSQRCDSASFPHNSFGSANSSTMSGPNTPQINFLQKQKEMREQHLEQLTISPSSGGVSPIPSPNNDYQGLLDKPPIPPRGMPPPISQRQLSYETANVNLRNRNNSSESNNNYSCTNNNTPQQTRPYSVQPVSPSNDEWNRNTDQRNSGWGNARYDAIRPTSLPPPGAPIDLQINVQPRVASAESSSESESHSISSINRGGKGRKEKKEKFWSFSKSKKSSKESGGDKKP